MRKILCILFIMAVFISNNAKAAENVTDNSTSAE